MNKNGYGRQIKSKNIQIQIKTSMDSQKLKN